MSYYDVVEVGSHPTLQTPGKGLGIKAIAGSPHHSTLFIAFGKKGETIDKQKDKNDYSVVEIPFNHKPLRTNLGFFGKVYRVVLKLYVIATFIFRMLRYLRRVDYQIINLHSLMLLPALVFISSNKKKILTFRGSDFEPFMKSKSMRYMASFCDEFHCVSLKHKFFLQEHYDKKIVIIDNFVDVEMFKSKMTTKRLNKKNIVVIAGLREVKGVDRSLKIFNELLQLDSDWTLNICGSGPEMNALKRWCQVNSIVDHVIFHGSLGREQLKTVIQSSCICMIDSRNEGFPKSMLEALAAGCFVAHSGQGECSRILDGLGFEYSVFDPGAIAAHIAQVSRNSDLFLHESARANILAEQYSKHEYCSRIENSYQILIR